MAKIVHQIPNLGDNKLLVLYQNALRLISKAPNNDAEEVISAVQAEWLKRLQLAEKSAYKAETPRVGMLGTLGYSVGESGVNTKRRRVILDKVFTGELPIVGSPAYTLEWGHPSSKTRYNKLHRTLQALINGGKTRDDRDMARAIIEWSEDLEYIERTYANLR